MKPETLSFLLFFVVAISVYSLMNYYLIKKHQNVLTSLGTLPSLLLRLVVVLLLLAPIAAAIFTKTGFQQLGLIFGFTGYSWLAFLFLFLVIHGTADIVLYLTEKTGIAPHPHTARYLLIFTMTLSAITLFYGRFEAESIGVNEVRFTTNKLPAHIHQFTIAQISDVHFSSMTGVKKAEQIKQIINTIKPDILISTGDLLDRGINNPTEIQTILSSINAPLGKYAIVGNHEYYYGIQQSIEFIKKSGFTLLYDQTATIADALNLVGVVDKTHQRFNLKREHDEISLLNTVDTNKYTILLKHQPHVEEASSHEFDLQLSGHTHAGQVFPFTALVKIVFPYLYGHYSLDSGASIYVNRGTGTWGPPFRFLAPPEITTIRIVNEPSQQTVARK